ncbi:response regulator [Fidelibacter multiformis]|uniref:response regulator n=1 Tax=Fidelibacter multiformis TaxID=3377529 RepID=UPI0037DC5DE1
MKKIRILLVEDEAIIAYNLSLELELEGYDVCGCVACGKKAIQKSQEEKPDLILMDISLQDDIDGIHTMEKIRKQQDIPVIFMTGYSQSDFSEQAKKLNPLGYFSKPVDVSLLTPIIKFYFGKAPEQL